MLNIRLTGNILQHTEIPNSNNVKTYQRSNYMQQNTPVGIKNSFIRILVYWECNWGVLF
jgi:hypothetical protein